MYQQFGGYNPLDVFDGIENQEPFKDFDYDQPGGYLVMLRKVFMKPSKKDGVLTFIIEKLILKVLRQHGNFVPSAPGSVASTAHKQSTFFLREVNGFISGVLGISSKQVSKAHVGAVASPKNPLAGLVVEINNKPSGEGDKFTRVTWCRPVPVAELRQLLTPQDIAALPQEVLPLIQNAPDIAQLRALLDQMVATPQAPAAPQQQFAPPPQQAQQQAPAWPPQQQFAPPPQQAQQQAPARPPQQQFAPLPQQAQQLGLLQQQFAPPPQQAQQQAPAWPPQQQFAPPPQQAPAWPPQQSVPWPPADDDEPPF